MIVVASTNGDVGIKESMRILKAGGSALDAVEVGHSVWWNEIHMTIRWGTVDTRISWVR